MSKKAERLRQRVRLCELLLEAAGAAKGADVVLSVDVEFVGDLKGEELEQVRPILKALLKSLP